MVDLVYTRTYARARFLTCVCMCASICFFERPASGSRQAVQAAFRPAYSNLAVACVPRSPSAKLSAAPLISKSPMCIKPVPCWIVGTTANGKRKLSFRPSPYRLNELGDLTVPCGKCAGCLADKSTRWVQRLQFENYVHSKSSFITLTYNNESLPPHGCAVKRDIQTFLKRLRNAGRDYGFDMPPIKYFVTSEHGSKTYRVHYHAIIFGVDMMDNVWRTTLHHMSGNYPVFVSDVLSEIWGKGFTTCDKVTSSSIKYVAKYITKGQFADDFHLQSMRLGVEYFCDYGFNECGRLVPTALNSRGKQMYDLGYTMLGDLSQSYKLGVPRFIDRYVEKWNPDLYKRHVQRKLDYVKTKCATVDIPDYVAHLEIESIRDKAKRKLHNESETLRHT